LTGQREAKKAIKGFTSDLFPRRTEDDIVSSNAKIVLYGLFFVVGVAVLLYAITVTNLSPSDSGTDAAAKLEQVDRLQQINSVYIAAISGALALGGTLIAQIWGRTRKTNRGQ
jgi:hypothetical protein